MKEIYKNPNFYYILVPAMLALWPLIAGGVYLPAAKRGLTDEMKDYQKARSRVAEILMLDPGRLDVAGQKEDAAEFVYSEAIDNVANLCGIPPTNYRPSTQPMHNRDGQKSRECRVVLTSVDIATFAKFLSTMQLRWAGLQCINTVLTKERGLPDKWKVDLDFKYYY
ncbi:MAG: hypothetical protein ACYSTG_10390 [Planctomycetota bacterium]|jgi:hypothetical protein